MRGGGGGITLDTHFELVNNALTNDGRVLLAEVGGGADLEPDPLGVGVFLHFAAEKPAARLVFPVGKLQDLGRFTCCHRYEPFWMKACAGTRAGEAPVETQVLLAELADDTCVLLVPLLDGPVRCSLQGTGEDGLELVAESGDPAVISSAATGLFVAVGNDPYALVRDGARSVAERLGTVRLRTEKPLPDFVDWFGWCTWDAFYQEVSQEKVRVGLESFRIGGVEPKVLILDDGWQSQQAAPGGAQRLTSFAANEKFGGSLEPTIRMAKDEFGVQQFLVWHAFNGYWGGVDPDSMPGYDVRLTSRSFSPGILHHKPTINEWWGGSVGVVAPRDIYRFFQDYHRRLRQEGVDGVKVDSQATLEGVAAGFGGRVELMRRYHEALEGSAHTHFGGTVINCMSCSNDMLYSALNSNVTRTSTDFWPNDPASHGLHLYVNAQVSLWFGEFIHPDWDMFQSGHPMGAYHAAARAIGGCPVYVSDKPEAHNFDLLRKLALPDGSVLRCDQPGLPTRDCLFHDPVEEEVLLKIFNRNEEGGVIGVFNTHPQPEGAPGESVRGVISPNDIWGIDGDRFAVYAHHAGELRVLDLGDAWEISLGPLEYEVYTIAPIADGFAPIGLANLFNSGGAILYRQVYPGDREEIGLRGGGRFVAWCEQAPRSVEFNDTPADFRYDAASNRLEVDLEFSPLTTIVIRKG